MSNRNISFVYIVTVLLYAIYNGDAERFWITTEELENHINPDDLREFLKVQDINTTITEETALGLEGPSTQEPLSNVDCFGLGSLSRQLPWLFNLQPDSAEKVNTHFYFSSRTQPVRVQVFPGAQFGLEWVDFKPYRKTVMIVHGFMSHSNASWVRDMTRAFLDWADVNVIAVDWSGGGNTWKYWRAVANTRRVGADVTQFMRQLLDISGANVKDLHFVGHSLGAHICSYVSYHIGGVSRITGHADFYPNGGMKQPGCFNRSNSIWSRIFPISPSKLQQAICSHGRAYLLFTESLINNNCTFRAHSWNLTYEGVNSSLLAACDRSASCAVMGIEAVGARGLPRAQGPYFAITTEKEPYCPTEWERRHPRPDLLRDLREGFRIDRWLRPTTSATPPPAYDADDYRDEMFVNDAPVTRQSWFSKFFGR